MDQRSWNKNVIIKIPIVWKNNGIKWNKIFVELVIFSEIRRSERKCIYFTVYKYLNILYASLIDRLTFSLYFQSYKNNISMG